MHTQIAMLSRVKFSVLPPRADRIHHINADDVRVVLGRLPVELWQRLRAVHFNDKGMARRLGYANVYSHELSICALPPRFSFNRYLRAPLTAQQFGAQTGKQWPTVAIRRFLLYAVFLHELGHLQPVPDRRASSRLKIAREKLAHQFAVKWCNWLWSQPFEHPDPAHHAPTLEETRLTLPAR
jgi:hypothetical protein